MRAADLYLGVERYVGQAAEVGVTLALPETFARDRADAFSDAVASLRGASGAAQASGDFPRALSLLSRARAYRPTASETADLDLDARDVYLLWAEDDFARGQFRRAYANANSALGYTGSDEATILRLRDLQAAVLDAGSVRVAFFPVEREGQAPAAAREATTTATAGRSAAARALGCLWRSPTTSTTSSTTTTGRARRSSSSPPIPPTCAACSAASAMPSDLVNRQRLLADLAGDLDADLGAAFSVGLWRETEEEQKREARQTRTRSGAAATYDRVRQRLTLGATVEYAVVDAGSRQVLCEGEVRRDVTDTITVHEYDGDWRDLAVDRDDRRLFTRRPPRRGRGGDAREAADRSRERRRGARVLVRRAAGAVAPEAGVGLWRRESPEARARGGGFRCVCLVAILSGQTLPAMRFALRPFSCRPRYASLRSSASRFRQRLDFWSRHRR